MADYEALRATNIERNNALLSSLGLHKLRPSPPPKRAAAPTVKRRRPEEAPPRPTRTSARLAAVERKPIGFYDGEEKERRSRRNGKGGGVIRPRRRVVPVADGVKEEEEEEEGEMKEDGNRDVDALRASWTAWTPSAEPPTRDAVTGNFHFPSHPTFTPNISPQEMLTLGVFGGSYFRPLHSSTLRTTISDDWRELPPSWTSNLDISRYLTSSTYNPDVNKYGVKCGQSIEEWEAAGWIDHTFDVRGWFQWYCRFWMGRRCADDERQVGRWRRCVGETGRWRRALLRKYVQSGIREVWDDGEGEEGGRDVSPVVHQTCLQWGWEVRQGVLERFWREGV